MNPSPSSLFEDSLLVRCLRQEEREIDSPLNLLGTAQVIHDDPHSRPGSSIIHYLVSGGLGRHRHAFLAAQHN